MILVLLKAFLARLDFGGITRDRANDASPPHVRRFSLSNSAGCSRKQRRQIADSIRRFGFTNPVLIDGDNRILAGHGRVEAARGLGMATAPVYASITCLWPKRAYVLADNKIALNAGWDEELLALELKEPMEADIDHSF